MNVVKVVAPAVNMIPQEWVSGWVKEWVKEWVSGWDREMLFFLKVWLRPAHYKSVTPKKTSCYEKSGGAVTCSRIHCVLLHVTT